MSSRRSPGNESNGPADAVTSTILSTRQPRITPRNSDGNGTISSAIQKDTPYGTLRQLANIPKPTTPLRRAASTGPPSNRSTRRTPTAQTRTPVAGQRISGSARRSNALTPHGRAAMREVEARRAGLTPGKDRRRSGRQQRETPRNDLRLLSRLMAPKTQPVVPTPQGNTIHPGRFTSIGSDDLDDIPDPVRPRFSLPLEGDDDIDDSLLLPPRSAGLEDENFTAQSMELPRRAISEQPPGRFPRGSFGSIRMSDQFADLNEFGIGGAFDSSFAIGGDIDDANFRDITDVIQEENTGTLREIQFDQGRISLASGRDSDIRLGTLPADDTENTFMFTVPPREIPNPQHSDTVIPEPFIEGEIDNSDWEEADRLDSHNLEPENQLDADATILNSTRHGPDTSIAVAKVRSKKRVKISKHGTQYPSLPSGIIKKLATQFARTSGSKAKISKDTLDAIIQASDWFFEQISDDLDAYATHARRKTIEESDIITLMKRQRQTSSTTTPFSLAQKFLPRELVQELRMTPPSKFKRGRQLEKGNESE